MTTRYKRPATYENLRMWLPGLYVIVVWLVIQHIIKASEPGHQSRACCKGVTKIEHQNFGATHGATVLVEIQSDFQEICKQWEIQKTSETSEEETQGLKCEALVENSFSLFLGFITVMENWFGLFWGFSGKLI